MSESTPDWLIPSLNRRLSGLRSAMDEQGLDAMVITPGADLRYLTGYDALPLERLTAL